MTDEAKKMRREYAREWRKKNPDKVRATLARYWERKAKAAATKDPQTDTE
ncbi:MAG: phosphatase [Clostridia bacterium]|nr:phosphatase [Clostridia bacterium]